MKKTSLEIIKCNNNAIDEHLKKFYKQPYSHEILSSYSGFGGAPQIMKDPYKDSEWKSTEKAIREEVLRFHETIKRVTQNKTDAYLNIINGIKSSTLTAYYTPDEIVSTITDNIKNYFGDERIKILDPSAGVGAFTKTFENHSIQSVEKERITSAILKSINTNPFHSVHGKGFEEFSKDNQDKFDLVISNIPFGSYKVFDSEYNKHKGIRKESTNRIHSYFFMKGVDLLNEGGILAYITSTAIADSKSHSSLRKELMMETKFVSLARLPMNTFSGTAVNTDVIILQKRNKRLTDEIYLTPDEKKFINTGVIKAENKGKEISQYINEILLDKEQTSFRLIGQPEIGYLHSKEQIVFTSEKNLAGVVNDLKTIITDDFQKVKRFKKEIVAETQLSLFESIKKEEYIKISKDEIQKYHLSEGDQFYKNGIYGEIKGNELIPNDFLTLSSQELDKRIHYLNIINQYCELEQIYRFHSLSDQKNLVREQFNQQYDSFLVKYGRINEPQNIYLFELRENNAPKYFEQYNEEKQSYEKTDLFFKDIEFEQLKEEFEEAENILNDENLSIKDLTNKSLNIYGEINISYISKSLKQEISTTITQGLERKIFFLNPKIGQLDINNNYTPVEKNSTGYKLVPKDEFLSGPIRFKIQEYERNSEYWQHLSEEHKEYSLQLLKKHDNEYIDIYKLDPQLGENWIPVQYYQRFANELLEIESSIHRSFTTSEYKIDFRGNSHANNQEWSVTGKSGKTYRGTKMLEIALNGTLPKITYSVKTSSGTETYLDREAIIDATNKINDIRLKWNEFVLKNPEVSQYIETTYNNTQNIDVERKYDGSHLEFKNLNPNITLRTHQKDGVWQTLIQNGGIIDHAVGAGKTLVMASLTMELQRLKIANKVMIIAMNANTESIFKEFKYAYPDAKVLSPSEKDFTPEKRKEYFEKMMNERWDAIILTHEQFAKIPQSREIQERIINEEINNLRKDLDDLSVDRNLPTTKRQYSGLEKRILNKEAQLLGLADSIRRDPDMITFDKMNVDHLIVDESQVFKNLEYTTRFENVAGLGNPQGSQRAFNLLMAVRTIQDKYQDDKGITFLSGTTISNSLVELYLLKKFLRPRELEKRYMSNFDGWARTYAKLEREFELTVTNEIKPKDRFRYFLKVPELARFYRSFSNIVTEDNLKVERPEMELHLIDVEPTPSQTNYMEALVNAVKAEDFTYFGRYLDENQMNAKMLIATTLASKISLDLRLIDTYHSQQDGSKVNQLTRTIHEIYHETGEHKGTQFVFLDMSTPTSKTAKEFNVYDAIRNTLSDEYNIPKEEIAFIHEHESKKKREALFSEVNQGNIRIVIGSSSKMGVGVNMQKRCVAMHHLDIPWNPKDFTQRNGRGVRQGNEVAKHYGNKVKTFVYATKGTLDAYKYFLMDLKARFINQIKNDNINFRSLDEGDVGENGEMSPAAFIAKLSGQEELLEKSKVDKKLSDLQLRKNILQKEHSRCSGSIKRIQSLLPKIKELGELYRIDSFKSQKLFSKDEKDKIIYSIETKDGQKISDSEKIKQYFSTEINQFIFDKKKEFKIGTIGKFSIVLKESFIENNDNIQKAYTMEIVSKMTNQSYKDGIINLTSPGWQYRMPYSALYNLEGKALRQEREAENLSKELNSEIKLLESIDISKHDKDIQILKEKSKELQRLIENNNSPDEPISEPIKEDDKTKNLEEKNKNKGMSM